MAFRRVSLKVVLLSVLVLLVVLCAVETSEMRGENVEKRAQGQNQTEMMTLLKSLQQRMDQLEAKTSSFFRGRDGRDGMPGKPGMPGKCLTCKDGAPGTKGVPGSRGRPGRNGQRGPQGRKGNRGPGGVKYIRWGRTTCPQSATLVYKGHVGGERYSHTGGGTNYLCLPATPKYGRYKDGHQDAAYVYGAEYQLEFNPFFRRYLNDHEAPCAVCYVQTRSTKMMIPATYQCPAGWTREYHGYLMTEFYRHPHPREFICVDQNAESVPGTGANHNGALLYPVEGRCGSLPCRPYVDGRQLTCAVCTR